MDTAEVIAGSGGGAGRGVWDTVTATGGAPADAADPPEELPDDPVENLLAGHPYLLLLRCRSMSHRREKTLPQLGHRWVPLWMCRWCWRDPGCLKILPHSSQLYRPIASGVRL